jgi:hypothetical protein
VGERFALTVEEGEQAGGIVALTRERGRQPVAGVPRHVAVPARWMDVPPDAGRARLGEEQALAVARSMIPGSIDTEMATVDVPVFLGR